MLTLSGLDTHCREIIVEDHNIFRFGEITLAYCDASRMHREWVDRGELAWVQSQTRRSAIGVQVTSRILDGWVEGAINSFVQDDK